jgi:hypothetical protein
VTGLEVCYQISRRRVQVPERIILPSLDQDLELGESLSGFVPSSQLIQFLAWIRVLKYYLATLEDERVSIVASASKRCARFSIK